MDLTINSQVHCLNHSSILISEGGVVQRKPAPQFAGFLCDRMTIGLLHLLDVLDKEDFFFLCHLLEIVGCGDAGRCAEVLTLEVAPR